jgi:transposase
MGNKNELTTEQRGAIFYCRQRGDSYKKISETVGCGKTTVFDTLKRYNETGSMDSKCRSGRPYLINNNQIKRLKRLVTNKKTQNRRLCATGVKELWKKKTGQNVSVNTTRRALYSLGLRNCITRRKPLISPANKATRLAWCLEHENWTKNDWAKVLWSDESTFTQFQQSRTSRVWREPTEEWSLSCVSATVKHSPSRMHWGCFSRQGVGPIVPLQGSATGATHVEILRKYVVPTMHRMFPNGDGLFQEDNATPHRSKIATAFRAEKDLHILSWPAQSPDLNPIENLWAEVKKNIYKRKKKPSNLAELEKFVQKEWKAIPKCLIENLVDSMPERIQAVISAEGGATKY